MPSHAITIELDDFGWTILCEEAERQNVTPEALLEHAAMYYMADLDSGRAAVQIFRRSVVDRGPGARFGKLRSSDERPTES